jgi:hypothetical protein
MEPETRPVIRLLSKRYQPVTSRILFLSFFLGKHESLFFHLFGCREVYRIEAFPPRSLIRTFVLSLFSVYSCSYLFHMFILLCI